MAEIITCENLRKFAEEYVSSYPEMADEKNIWRTPLLVTAKADGRFDALKDIGVPDHLLPKDLLPSAKSVVVFFVPLSRS